MSMEAGMTSAALPIEARNPSARTGGPGPGLSGHACPAATYEYEYGYAYYWWYWTVSTTGCHVLVKHR